MKKAFVIIVAAVMAAVLCISASAVVNSNHLIDEGFPRFNSDESEWDVFCWTVVDTRITAMGYKVDGGDVVWVDESIDTRDSAKKVAANECFEDMELERAIVDMSLSNGLEDFYGYRIHITLDTSRLSVGEHYLEVAVKYEDGSVGNPLRDTAVTINKTKAPVEGADEGDSETKAEAVTPVTGETSEQPVEVIHSNPDTSDAAVVAIAAVAAAAFAGVVLSKKIK